MSNLVTDYTCLNKRIKDICVLKNSKQHHHTRTVTNYVVTNVTAFQGKLINTLNPNNTLHNKIPTCAQSNINSTNQNTPPTSVVIEDYVSVNDHCTTALHLL